MGKFSHLGQMVVMPSLGRRVAGGGVDTRITEAGDTRITEAGDTRVTLDSDPLTTTIASDGYGSTYTNMASDRQEVMVSKTVSGTTYQVVAYWDNDGFLTFAKRSLPSTTWTTYTTAITVAGVNSHYFISMGIDPDGYIHVAYNMHNDALVYRKSDNPIATFDGNTSSASMLGTNESAVAYPRFLHGNDDSLYFMFRDGAAGNGDGYFYAYDEVAGTWSAATGTSTAGLLIDGKNESPTESPYFGLSHFDDAGDLHLVWTWRESGVSDQHDLSYVKWDGASFVQADGTAQTVPITPANADIADNVAAGNGLIPVAYIDADGNENPHIAYAYDDGNGNRQVWHVWNNGSTWTTKQISDTDDTSNIKTLFVSRSTNEVYIVWSDSIVENGMLEEVSDAGDFTTWSRRNIYPDADTTVWGLWLDWQQWRDDGQLSTTLWYRADPADDADWPIYLLEWTP